MTTVVYDFSRCNCGAGPSGIHSGWCELAKDHPLNAALPKFKAVRSDPREGATPPVEE